MLIPIIIPVNSCALTGTKSGKLDQNVIPVIGPVCKEIALTGTKSGRLDQIFVPVIGPVCKKLTNRYGSSSSVLPRFSSPATSPPTCVISPEPDSSIKLGHISAVKLLLLRSIREANSSPFSSNRERHLLLCSRPLSRPPPRTQSTLSARAPVTTPPLFSSHHRRRLHRKPHRKTPSPESLFREAQARDPICFFEPDPTRPTPVRPGPDLNSRPRLNKAHLCASFCSNHELPRHQSEPESVLVNQP